MSCLETDLLSAYADRECSAAEKALAEGHLNGCPRCRAALKALEVLKEAVRAQPAPDMPRELRGVLGQLVPDRPSPWAEVWQRLRRPALVPVWGLATALFAVGGWWAMRGAGDVVSLDEVMSAHRLYAATMPAAEAERLLSELSDGL